MDDAAGSAPLKVVAFGPADVAAGLWAPHDSCQLPGMTCSPEHDHTRVPVVRNLPVLDVRLSDCHCGHDADSASRSNCHYQTSRPALHTWMIIPLHSVSLPTFSSFLGLFSSSLLISASSFSFLMAPLSLMPSFSYQFLCSFILSSFSMPILTLQSVSSFSFCSQLHVSYSEEQRHVRSSSLTPPSLCTSSLPSSWFPGRSQGSGLCGRNFVC